MAEQVPETLNHFAIISFTPAYAQLPPAERHARLRRWLEAARAAADVQHMYQLRGLEAEGELLLWSGCASAEPARTRAFFSGWAAAAAEMRGLIELRQVLWGFTRPSPYTRTRSAQELDPFQPGRRPFLVVYPFVKTAGWYQLPREQRQALMGDHIRIGTRFKEITQLLLYSFGLQDQEFVVVYEMEDPRRFLELVQELRSAEGRPYTERDAPVHAGLQQEGVEALFAWL